MGIIDKVRRLEQQLERLAERSDIPMQPIEIRKATLDEVEDLVQPAGRSRKVFPFNRVTVEVVAAEPAQRAAIEAVLGDESDLAAAVRERLKTAGCPEPRGLTVRLRVVKKAGAEWETGRVFRLLCERSSQEAEAATAGREEAATAAARPAPARITIVKGDATRKSYVVNAERINVGRLAEVVDKDKRVVRRNQVVFTDIENAVNQSVSRAHAHIATTPKGEFRLFDDRSSYGTRIFRSGRTITLPAGSPRGARLQPGDEISFGRACVRFDTE
jgi:hypothetical protein